MKEDGKQKGEATVHGVVFAIFATFLARGFGFFRELMTASAFGTSGQGDAFIIALSIPDILSSGFGTVIAALYIPTIFKIRNEKIRTDEENRYNSSILFAMFLLGAAITGIVEVFPESIVNVFASGFDKETFGIAVFMTRITVITVIPVFIGSLLKAYGQIINKFALLTLLGSIINVVTIISLCVSSKNDLSALAYSVLLGNVLYVIIAFIVVNQNGFKMSGKLSLKNPYMIGMISGILPIFISNIISEINQIIDKNFASHLSSGTISALNYSSKVVNLITAILGTAVSSVFFPQLSMLAASKNYQLVAKHVNQITCILFSILVPILYGTIIFSHKIITILFGHGNFNSNSVQVTAQCLVFYSIGILGFNVKAFWTRVYNSSLNTKIPAINSAVAVGLNIILNIALMPILQHRGLALATGIASVFTDVLLIFQYSKINPYFDLIRMIRELLKIAIASLPIIPVLKLTELYAPNGVLGTVLCGGIAFFLSIILYMLVLFRINSEVAKKIRIRLKVANRNKK